MFQLGQAHSAVAEHYLGNAVRVLFALGGHLCKRPKSKISQTETCFNFLGSENWVSTPSSTVSGMSVTDSTDSHLRRLFWFCHILDKDLCLRSGRPPLLNDADCDLDLPSVYAVFPLQDNDAFQRTAISPGIRTTGPSNFVPFFTTDLRLSILKSKAYTRLYSRQALKQNEVALLRTIRELDEELEDWKASLPAACRPERTAEITRSDNSILDVRVLLNHTEYFYLVGLIHRAANRCAAQAYNENCNSDSEDGSLAALMGAGVASSQQMCLESCRSMLFCLSKTTVAFTSDELW